MTISSIKFVICGLEHSGTTLAADLFRQHPECDSGFECGVLLCDAPIDFPNQQPFYHNMTEGWGLDKNELYTSCQTTSFNTFYESIIKYSRVLQEKSPSIVFDKTPRYIVRINEILEKTNLPIIAMIKDPRAIAASDLKRAKIDQDMISDWYREWKPKKLGYMRKAYQGYLRAWDDNRCCVVRLEDLCLNTKSTFEKMFEHVRIDPSLSYLRLANKRYKNTKGDSISPSSCISFRELISEKLEDQIIEDFSEFKRWFYDFGKLT